MDNQEQLNQKETGRDTIRILRRENKKRKRNAFTFKSIGCSCRESEFNFQNATGGSQPFATSFRGNLMTSDYLGHRYVHCHT